MDTKGSTTHAMKDASIDKALHAEPGPEKFFSLGLQCLKQNLLAKAHRAFAQAYKLQPQEPRYCSYYGLTTALVYRNLKLALELCGAAMVNNYMYPDLFCNLGRVYLLAGQRQKAYGAFKAGLRLDDSNRDLHTQLAQMGIRKPAVFPFLDRNHPVNYIAGKIRHRLTLTKPGPQEYVRKIMG